MQLFRCHDQKDRIVSLTRVFDTLLALGAEREIIAMLRDQATRQPPTPVHSQRLHDYFFIWIGSPPAIALEYIDVWQETIRGTGSLRIYYDSHFVLFNHLRTQFERLYQVNSATPPARRIRCQNHFHRSLAGLMQQGLYFDQALIKVTAQRAPADAARLQAALFSAQQRIDSLKQRYALRDIRLESGLFTEPFFERIYTMELCLRANAAAAADILRLLLLYRHGGVYVDVDTLPSLQPIYGPLSDHANGNVQQIVRAELFLCRRRRLRRLKTLRPDTDGLYQQYLQEQDPHLLAYIRHCAEQWDGSPLPVPNVRVHADLLTMAAMATPGEFNNNLLAAAPRAKLVRIVLREIRRRYRFIFKYGLDRQPRADLPAGHYLARLRDYRLDALHGADNVTLFLTGPVMLLEMLLGVAYELLGMEKSIRPLALSYALQLNELAVACSEQTGYTPEHMRSSWM